jgi:hypothetical protein
VIRLESRTLFADLSAGIDAGKIELPKLFDVAPPNPHAVAVFL